MIDYILDGLLFFIAGCSGYAIGVIDWNRLAGRFTAWQLRRRYPLPTLPKTTDDALIADLNLDGPWHTISGTNPKGRRLNRDEWPEVIE